MRNAARSFAVATSIGVIAIACGSNSPVSEFGEPGPDQNGNDSGPPPKFNSGDASALEDGKGGNCKPQTCAAAGANCGPIGDGCGGVIANCGTCDAGDSCGGGGTPSQCGHPACSPKTCTDLGANCGAAGDGCGGLIPSCGTCEAGTCGGGGPSKCGIGGGDGGVGDGGVCVPTKVACAVDDCGPIADGCGGLLNCPATCPTGQSCGGGGTPSVCGAPPCVKATCGTQNCGFIADGCGGVVSCWPVGTSVCGPGQSCGGAGTANMCGTAPGCTGLCLQQQACAGGATTSIEGYVTSPNGVLPVPNAVVYVPNGSVAAFTSNVQCETCATASGNPLVSTTTDANGHFLLPNMPVSTPGQVVDIPVVVQLGRWRKQFTIATTACANNLVPSVGAAPANKTAALPSSKAEGDIPLTAISTGRVDGLECVFRKMGVSDTEFTDSAGDGRIRLYQDNGAMISAGSNKAWTLYNTQAELDKYDAVIFGCVGGEVSKGSTELTRLLNYANKGGRVFATHYSYVWLNSNTTWRSTASRWAPDTQGWDATAAPGSLSAVIDTSFPKGMLFSSWLQAPIAPVSATFAPPYAPLAALYASSPPMLALTEPRKDINPYFCTGGSNDGTRCNALNPGSTCKGGGTCTGLATNSGIVAPAQRWIYTTDDDGKACVTGANCKSGVCTADKCVGSQTFHPASDPLPQDAPMHYTFNTDRTKPVDEQCGRVVYSDFHVSIGTTQDEVFPAECNSDPLTSQEKVLAYMLFDLASCVSPSTPPACTPKTCLAQGLGCGLAGDGCGNQIDCGSCPLGQTCGGGGVPSQCGAPACTPTTCPIGACGMMGNGCGGSISCGTCATGTCGGGGANLCGGGACTPLACPTPSAGSVCGPVADGCGAVNNCPCPSGVPCVNGLCGAPPCVPRTCASAGANCGTIADGCGATVTCGTCIAPQSCGGGGTANLCGGGVN